MKNLHFLLHLRITLDFKSVPIEKSLNIEVECNVILLLLAMPNARACPRFLAMVKSTSAPVVGLVALSVKACYSIKSKEETNS